MKQYIVIGINSGHHYKGGPGYGTKVFGVGTREAMICLKHQVNSHADKRPYGVSWYPAIIKKITPLKQLK